MKNKIPYITLIASIVSVVLNIFLIVLVLNTNNCNSNINNMDDINLKYNQKKDDPIGIYQITYYNTYNKQMIYTVRLKENGECFYVNKAADYSGEGSVCTYTIDDKEISLTIGEGESAYTKKAEILNDGTLYIDGKRLVKIN